MNRPLPRDLSIRLMNRAGRFRAICDKHHSHYREVAWIMLMDCMALCLGWQEQNPRGKSILYLPDAYYEMAQRWQAELKRRYGNPPVLNPPYSRNDYLRDRYFADATDDMILNAERFLRKLYVGQDRKFLNIRRTEDGNIEILDDVDVNWLIDEHIKLLDPFPIFVEVDRYYRLGKPEMGQAILTAYAYCRSRTHSSYWKAIRKMAPDKPFREALWDELMKEVLVITGHGLLPRMLRNLPHQAMNNIRGSRKKTDNANDEFPDGDYEWVIEDSPRSYVSPPSRPSTPRVLCKFLAEAIRLARLHPESARYWNLRNQGKTREQTSLIYGVTEQAVKKGLSRNRSRIIAACPFKPHRTMCCLLHEKNL